MEHLEACWATFQNDWYYPEMADKLTHLVIRSQEPSFQRRQQALVYRPGRVLLELNGYDYVVKRFVLEMENIAVYVASNVVGKDLLREIILRAV